MEGANYCEHLLVAQFNEMLGTQSIHRELRLESHETKPWKRVIHQDKECDTRQTSRLPSKGQLTTRTASFSVKHQDDFLNLEIRNTFKNEYKTHWTPLREKFLHLLLSCLKRHATNKHFAGLFLRRHLLGSLIQDEHITSLGLSTVS